LPNVGPYIYDVSISGFTRSSIYIHDISSLRVKTDVHSAFNPQQILLIFSIHATCCGLTDHP